MAAGASAWVLPSDADAVLENGIGAGATGRSPAGSQDGSSERIAARLAFRPFGSAQRWMTSPFEVMITHWPSRFSRVARRELSGRTEPMRTMYMPDLSSMSARPLAT